MPNAEIVGWGKAMPPTVLSNADLERIVDTNDEWITTRTGMKERRISHVEASDLAAVASLRALAAAGMDPGEIDFMINATCTPESIIPASVAYLQAKIGAVGAGAIDVNANCSGFIYAMVMASSLIQTGIARNVLLTGVEKMHYVMDYSDRSTCILFGDGAGAAVMRPTDEPIGLLSGMMGNDGRIAEHLTVPSFGSSGTRAPRAASSCGVVMNGPEIFRNAVVRMGEAALEVATNVGWAIEDIDLLIPHQANKRIIDATARRLDLDEDKVFVNVHKYGNTSSATIPVALTEAIEEERIPPHANLVFAAFGGGLSWAAAAVKWGERVTPVGHSDAQIPEFEGTVFDILQPSLDFFGVGVKP
ncbi:MAG TPA: beta-ketoacyl-ACP synthase III [Acidimicrobiia bacterium]|nr:beta-ketoacyl-ACP synthase III [Acidimicrobiia bacterium]